MKAARSVLCVSMWSAAVAGMASAESPPTVPVPSWGDSGGTEQLWQETRPISADEHAAWSQAYAALGGVENAACRYTRLRAPCPDCGPAHPRELSDAAEISLVGGLPRLLPLSVWFDTPAVHDTGAWVEERFDPSAPHLPWTLMRMDGAAPAARQLQDYQAEKNAGAAARQRARRIAEDKGRVLPDAFHPAVVQPLFAARPPTVSLGRSGGLLYLGAKAERGASSPLARAAFTTYVVDTEAPSLLFFEERMAGSHSPHFGLRLADYRRFGALARDANTGSVVVTHMDYALRARLTVVFSQAHHTIHWFSDFDCATSV